MHSPKGLTNKITSILKHAQIQRKMKNTNRSQYHSFNSNVPGNNGIVGKYSLIYLTWWSHWARGSRWAGRPH